MTAAAWGEKEPPSMGIPGIAFVNGRRKTDGDGGRRGCRCGVVTTMVGVVVDSQRYTRTMQEEVLEAKK